MYILHRSILRELVLSFLLSVVFLNFTLMMEKLLRLSRLLSSVGASPFDVAQIILFLQPQLFILTIPMAMLLSVLLTYFRLTADNELVIMRNIGMPFRLIARPVMYLGIACFAVSLSMSFYLGPAGSVMLREKVTNILVTRAPLAIEEGIFNTSFKDMVMLVKEKPAPDKLSGIFIVDERKKDEPKIIVAKEGRILSEADALSFALRGGHVYITGKNSFTEIQFGAYYFRLTPSLDPGARKGSELTPFELIAESRITPDKKIPYLLELYRRLSMPGVCLIIIFLGPSLALIAGKTGRLGGLTIGLLVFAAYYSVMIYGENLARSGVLPHFIGAWISFVLLGTFSIFAFERVNKT
jgi:lipopolysaccharide export system permease protein